MFKKLLTAVLITSILVLPFASAALAGHEEAPVPVQNYRPGSAPAETHAAEAMSPVLHALVLALMNQEAGQFDGNSPDLAWEALYNMLSLYGQMDNRSISDQGELFFPEETVWDYAAALNLDLARLGAPPAALRDRIRYDSASHSYVAVCGEDGLSQLQVDSARAAGKDVALTGSLVYAVDGAALVRFQASLQPQDNMFGYTLTGMRVF